MHSYFGQCRCRNIDLGQNATLCARLKPDPEIGLSVGAGDIPNEW
jgi:hypothetical protein